MQPGVRQLSCGFQRIKDRETAAQQSQEELELAAKLKQQVKGLNEQTSLISSLLKKLNKK